MAQEDAGSLITAALEAQQAAYAPYSGFRVGAAVKTADGSIFAGCNVENASYGLTCCAERVAVFAAIAQGEQTFEMIAVASPGGVAPCGACRQVLAEFSDELVVLLVDSDNPSTSRRTTINELLPLRFDSKRLP